MACGVQRQEACVALRRSAAWRLCVEVACSKPLKRDATSGRTHKRERRQRRREKKERDLRRRGAKKSKLKEESYFDSLKEGVRD